MAKTELYRKKRGWIERGFKRRELRLVQTSESEFIIPWFSKNAIGIGTTSYDNEWTIIAICALVDPEASYAYCENHLLLPKARRPFEFKWAKLNSQHRENVIENLDFFLRLSCDGVLTLKTNSLIKPVEKLSDVFIKLIKGCFSGYEYKGPERKALKNKIFKMVNDVPIHCDADFRPLTTDKIVRFLVKTLSDGKDFTPLHVEKKSEESKPIQLADIICGSLKKHFANRTWKSTGIQPLEFDNRLKCRNRGKIAKAYLWLAS